MSWSEVRLGDVTENFDAVRVPVRAADRRPGPYPYYGASGVVDCVDSYLFDGEYLLVAEDGENLRTRKTPIAFVTRGKFWVNNHAHVIRGNGRADTRFLTYYLSVADIAGYLSGSTQPKLTQASLNRIPIRLPQIDEQRAIAGVLGALDDKIELNRRMNETLEDIGQARFKGMLRSSEGSSASLAAITSERSERVGNRSAIVLSAIASGELVRSDDHFTKRVYSTEITKYKAVRQFDYAYNPSRINIGSVGMHVEPELGAVSPVYVVASVDAEYRWFLRFFLQLESTRSLIRAFASGSVRQTLTYRDFASIPAVLPTARELAAFNAAWVLLDRKIRANAAESRTLAELRDALLPKLISGELRVRDAEAAVEAGAQPKRA